MTKFSWLLALLLSFVVGCSCAKHIEAATTPDAEPQTKVTVTYHDPSDHTVYLNGTVDDEMFFGFVTDTTLALNAKDEYVVYQINSPGGDLDVAFKMAQMIEALPVPSICLVDGDADSAMFFILQSCNVRMATTRSNLMLHGVKLAGLTIGERDLPRIALLLKMANSQIIGQCYKMHMTPEQIKAKIDQGDWWMTPQEALEVGAIDKVIEPISLTNQ